VTAAGRINAVLVAPGASVAETGVSYGAAVTGAALAAVGALRAGLDPLPAVVLAAVGFDLVGGSVVNATAAAKRRFHGAGGSDRRRFAFVAGHMHPFAIALLVPGFGWTAAALAYALSVAGAAAVLAAGPPIRRPLAFAITAVGSVAALVLAPLPAFLAWITPVLLVKLLIGHLLPEESR